MKNTFVKLVCLLLISYNAYSNDDIKDSQLQKVPLNEYSPCSDQYEINDSEANYITSSLLLSGDAFFSKGDMIISSTNAKAIVDSFDLSSNILIYYQTAKTGFKSFSLGEKLVGNGVNVSTVERFILDFRIPCSDLVVSIEENPEQMMFIFADSDEAIKAELAAQEMMAEIKIEMLRQAALDAFRQKLVDEKAAAATSTAAYQAKLAYDMRVTKIMDELIVQLDELGITDDYKSTIADELINEATKKLEDEKFIGTISGEIVTVAIHEFCKVNLGLSDSNIELFKNALEGGYLGNVGPQVTNGTEFSSNRWDDYIDCVGSKRV